MTVNPMPVEALADIYYNELPDIMGKKEDISLPLLIAGKKQAFEEFYTSWYRRICYYAWQMVREECAAEDIALETFTKAWEKRATFKNPQHLHRFMYHVTRNACISWLRQQLTQKKTLQILAYLSERSDSDPDFEKIHTEIIEKAFQLIDELPETDNRIIRLSLLEGQSLDVIARELSITPNSVAVKKFRALTLLKSLLRQAGN